MKGRTRLSVPAPSACRTLPLRCRFVSQRVLLQHDLFATRQGSGFLFALILLTTEGGHRGRAPRQHYRAVQRFLEHREVRKSLGPLSGI